MAATRTIVIALALGLANAVQAETQKYVVMSNGEKVGHLIADVQGAHAEIDYYVNNNGRGPKVREAIELDKSGVPVRWTIEGQSTFGSAVSERFEWQAGKATWHSQADQGSAPSAKPMAYIGNDASPWMLGVYVRQLLKSPERMLSVLPSGRLRLSQMRDLKLGEGSSAVELTMYELSGVTFEPEYVLIDRRGNLFGAGDGGFVREGYEQHYPELQQVAREVKMHAAEDAQKKLARRFAGPVRIRNVRIFDPVSMKVGPLSQVVIYEDRIAGVMPDEGAAAKPQETLIDGQGGTLVPGLHDMHSHTSLSSNLFNLAAGVTTTRDQGNDNEELLSISRALDAGRLAGPRIVRNGLLEGRSSYSARIGAVASSLEEALNHVRWYADHGYFQIKIYNSLPPEWVAPVAARAHELGLGVTGHVPAFSSPDRVIAEGYNDIAHINQLMLGWILNPGEDTRTTLRLTGMVRGRDLDLDSTRVRTTVAAMKARGVALDTTACALEQLMLSRAGKVQPGDVAYLDRMPISFQRYRQRSFVTVNDEREDQAWRAAYRKLLDVLKMLDTEGIQLLPGTDDLNGFMQLRELELYVDAGISPGRALYLATLGSARYLKQDSQHGSIERGKLADFFLVDGDPTANIAAVRKNRMTMKGGVAYFPAEIYQHLAVTPSSQPPPVTM